MSNAECVAMKGGSEGLADDAGKGSGIPCFPRAAGPAAGRGQGIS